jgi:hypothetical protein
MPTNTAITIACYCTLLFEALGFWFLNSVFTDYTSAFVISVGPGWAPIVMIALRSHTKKIETLRWLDIGIMVSGFPIVFGTMIVISRFALR